MLLTWYPLVWTLVLLPSVLITSLPSFVATPSICIGFVHVQEVFSSPRACPARSPASTEYAGSGFVQDIVPEVFVCAAKALASARVSRNAQIIQIGRASCRERV